MSRLSNHSFRCSSYVLYTNRQMFDHTLMPRNDDSSGERNHGDAVVQICEAEEETRLKNGHCLLLCILGFLALIGVVYVIYHVARK